MFHLTARLGSLLNRMHCRHNDVIKVYPPPSAKGNSVQVMDVCRGKAILNTDHRHEHCRSAGSSHPCKVTSNGMWDGWMDDGSHPHQAACVTGRHPWLVPAPEWIRSAMLCVLFFLPCALQTDLFSCTAPVLSCWEIQAVLGISWGQVHLS